MASRYRDSARTHGGRSVPRRPRGAVAGGSTPRRLADRRRALRRDGGVVGPEYGDRLFVHDRSSLFRLPAEGIVRATNPAPTLDPSFGLGREDRGEVSRFCRASLRAGVARLLARSVSALILALIHCPYSPSCVEGGFCELRLGGVLRS